MQSLHPLPRTNPLEGTTGKQVPREDIIMSKQTYFLPAPIPASGSEVFVGQEGVSQTRAARGPEREAADLKGCMVVTVGEGERSNLSTKF